MDLAVTEVKVTIEDDQLVTTSRNVAAVFRKEHRNVLRDIESLKEDVLNFEHMFRETTMPDSYGREQRVYLMNRDGFTLLAMGFTGAEAMQWKLKYIEAFNKMEKFINSPEQLMARALRAADQTIASLESKMLEAQKTIEQKDKVIEAQKPKALFADAVATSKTSILMGDLAKLICQNGVQIGQNRLFNWMRDNGFLMKYGASRNMPVQRYVEQGLFEVKESTVQNPDGSVRVTKTTKVTGKGQVYFVQLFLRGVEA